MFFAARRYWSGFFSPPTTRGPQLGTPLRLEALEARLVPALSPVADATAYPYRAIVKIEAHFPNQADDWTTVGTGTLIDSSHVLTAGHVVYNAAEGGWPDQIKVIAGHDGPNDEPYGVAFGTLERTYQQFVDNSNNGIYDEHGDIGLITLDRPLGDTVGWFGFGWKGDDSFFQGLNLNVAGYPAEQGYSGDYLYHESGQITGPTADGQLVSWSLNSLSAIPGESGSGMYVYNASGDPTIYAVLDSHSDDGTGYGSRITEGVFDDLQAWMRQDGKPAATADGTPASALAHTTFTVPANGSTDGGAQTSSGFTYVLGQDHNLWLEPSNWIQTVGPRTHVDAGVLDFAPATDGSGNVYVLGQDHNLWLESSNWFQTFGPRTHVDAGVLSFKPANDGTGNVFVLGLDHNLWLEPSDWFQNRGPRTHVDAGVLDFAPATDGSGNVYVLGLDHNLWLESSSWFQNRGPRTQVDAGVLDFTPLADGSGNVYVLGQDHNLWLESSNWFQTFGPRTHVDAGVLSFKPANDGTGNVFVLGLDHNLWLEPSDWFQNRGPRTRVDASVLDFDPADDASGQIYVLGLDHSLWLEPVNRLTSFGIRNLVDSGVGLLKPSS